MDLPGLRFFVRSSALRREIRHTPGLFRTGLLRRDLRERERRDVFIKRGAELDLILVLDGAPCTLLINDDLLHVVQDILHEDPLAR